MSYNASTVIAIGILSLQAHSTGAISILYITYLYAYATISCLAIYIGWSCGGLHLQKQQYHK